MAIPIIGATAEMISSSMIAIAAIAIVIAMASKQKDECAWSSVVCGLSAAAQAKNKYLFWRSIFGVSVRQRRYFGAQILTCASCHRMYNLVQIFYLTCSLRDLREQHIQNRDFSEYRFRGSVGINSIHETSFRTSRFSSVQFKISLFG